MKRVFLSYHFGDDDEIARKVIRLIESHNIRVITGENVGGNSLTPEILKLIESCQAFVALMTPRETEPTNGGTHQWVVDEFKHARGRDIPAINLVWEGVNLGGTFSNNEYIPYEEGAEVDAFIKLSRTIGYWKRASGRIIKAQIRPENIASVLAASGESATCQFRSWENGSAGEWQEGKVSPEANGTVAYLPGVPEGANLQIQCRVPGTEWVSRVFDQAITVELNSLGQA